MTSTSQRGQILVIVAAGLVVFLGFAALVVDIGQLYASQRYQRNLTDAAALAGGQELQQLGSRAVTAADRTDARRVAMENLMNELAPGDPLPPCGYGSDFTDCTIPGTDWTVSMQAPSPICVTCDPNRSLLVSLERQNVPTFFARLLGRDEWDIRQTSVAGISFEMRYAVITLRPPRNGFPSQNDPNVAIDGSGSSLTVVNGDIGTNTNLVSSGSVALDDGFLVGHYDKPQKWTSPPNGHPIPNVIPDPMYTIPSEAGAAGPWTTLAGGRMTATECLAVVGTVPGNYVFAGTTVNTLDPTAGDKVSCYRPGIYNVELQGDNGEFILLTPGVYFLNRGADLNGNYLIGGWTAGAPGVALVFNECNPGGGTGCSLRGEAALALALNAGAAYQDNLGAPEAAPARTADGTSVTSTGIAPAEVALTLMVRKDPVCVVGPYEPSPNCSPPKNSTLKLRGGAGMYLAGALYAPTDNVSFSGNSSADGYVGQIVSWTVTYSGGTDVRQVYPGQEGNGILRLDAACSGAGATSMSNLACRP